MEASAQFSHVYVTMYGNFLPTSYWAGESAQMGLRIGCWPDTASIEPIGVLPLREAQYVGVGHDETNWSVLEGWRGETVVPSGARYWDYATQLAVAENVWTYLTALKGLFNTAFNWTGVKIAAISPDGKTKVQPSLFTRKTPLLGTAADNLPPQMSIAASLIRPVPGRAGRGRMYLPALGRSATLGTNGKVGTTAITSILNATKALVNDISSHGSVDIDYKVLVTSANSSKYVLPNQVRVGDLFDTQRRRRNQVTESYTTASL